MLKLIRNECSPKSSEEFYQSIKIYFPQKVDVKLVIQKEKKFKKLGLSKLADALLVIFSWYSVVELGLNIKPVVTPCWRCSATFKSSMSLNTFLKEHWKRTTKFLGLGSPNQNPSIFNCIPSPKLIPEWTKRTGKSCSKTFTFTKISTKAPSLNLICSWSTNHISIRCFSVILTRLMSQNRVKSTRSIRVASCNRIRII